MRLFAPLLLLLVADPSRAETPVSRCFAACERHVTDARQRASVCGVCLTSPERADAWLSRLSTPAPGLLADDDWEVRWGGLIAEARAQKTTGARRLAAWVQRAKGEELRRACLTGVHAAGELKQSLAALLKGEPKALASCEGEVKALREAAWLDLYSESPSRRLEALQHLAQAFGRGAGRELLDALPSHPPAFDELVLDTLASLSLHGDRSAALELLSAATPADVEAMNRVLAVYARRRDEARPLLKHADEAVRREALTRLCDAAPLSEPELLEALGDPAGPLRLKAARGLARGEGRALSAMVGARLSGEKNATVAQQRVLLELMADFHDPGCAKVALSAWPHAALAPELKRRVLAVAASCDWKEAEPVVLRAIEAPGELERAAGIAALGSAPRTPALEEKLVAALAAREASVRGAACQALAGHRWRAAAVQVEPLANDGDAAVRGEALRTLVALDAPGLEAKLTAALQRDGAAKVRATAAELLQGFGSPRALSALEQAAKADADPGVKLVAGQSLRKLAPGSRSP